MAAAAAAEQVVVCLPHSHLIVNLIFKKGNGSSVCKQFVHRYSVYGRARYAEIFSSYYYYYHSCVFQFVSLYITL